MEKACLLFICDWQCCVSFSINAAKNIPVCLGTIGHEFLEVRILDFVATDDGIVILLNDHLGNDILKLHIAQGNGYHTAVRG